MDRIRGSDHIVHTSACGVPSRTQIRETPINLFLTLREWPGASHPLRGTEVHDCLSTTPLCM